MGPGRGRRFVLVEPRLCIKTDEEQGPELMAFAISWRIKELLILSILSVKLGGRIFGLFTFVGALEEAG